MSTFHLALRRAVPWTQKDSVDNSRWALLALDPSRGIVRCGAFAASDGENVPYRLWLAKSARAAVLLLHGCCDYSGAFDDIAPKLVRRGFSCFAYDQRGFGATASRGKWMGETRMVADVSDAVNFFRLRAASDLPLFVIGESMGGSVAIHAAARRSDLNVAGIILVAPGALASALRNTIYKWVMSMIRILGGQSEIVVERTNADELTPAAALRLLGDPMVMQAIGAELLAGVIGMGYSAVGAAAQVHVPTLTMTAGRDDLLRSDCVRALYEQLRGEKRLVSIRGAPHLLLHWQRGGVALRHARHWIERRLDQ